MHDGPTAFRFELAGNLNREGALRLDQDWVTASSVAGDRRLIVDITFVTGATGEGGALLARWHGEGAQLIANSKTSRALAEAILGKPLPETANGQAASASDRTWLPRAAFVPSALKLALLLAIFLVPIRVGAATLKPETVAAWEEYLRTADANLNERVRPGGTFLWTFENEDRAAKVRGGEIVVAPAPGKVPLKVPGGLIHHWMSAVYLPNLKLDEVIEVTREYDRYKEFYRPSVIESKTIAHRGSEDLFSMVLMNKAFFMETALDADYDANNVRLDDRRAYSISRTTRVQEIQAYRQADERRIREGEGGGYIWKLYSVARFEERDGGVYVEMEAIALSRDIPVALRVVVDPIVRRVSRNSLLISLRQTEEAVRGSSVATARSKAGATSTEEASGVPASLPGASSAFVRVH
jgi:hypothetical protein